MVRIRFMALVLFAITFMGNQWSGDLAARLLAASLEGTWEIVSVHREGGLDPGQLGSSLTFADDTVTLKPGILRYVDLSSTTRSQGNIGVAGPEPFKRIEPLALS